MNRLQLPVGSVLVWLVIDALTVYRLAWLFTRDSLFEPWRAWLARRYVGGWMVELLMCGYCLSVWFAAAAAVLTWQVPHVWFWIALPAAIAGATNLLLQHSK